MKYEVLRKTTNDDDAFDVLTTLPQPILIIIFGENSEVREHIYQDVVNKVKRKVVVVCQGDMPWTAKEMVSKGRNCILRVKESLGCSSGDLHKVITDLSLMVNQKGGSIAGICIKNTLHSSNFNYGAEAYSTPDGSLDCLIKVAP